MRLSDKHLLRLAVVRLQRVIDCNMPIEMIADGVANIVEAASNVCNDQLRVELTRRAVESSQRSGSFTLAAGINS